jgi:hypothetical protein
MLVSAVAILALIVVAALSVAVIDSHAISDPLQRDLVRPASAPLPKTGTLFVRLVSNQNFTSVVSSPLGAPVPVPRWPMTLTTINSSVISAAPIPLSTDVHGVAIATLLPGVYVLRTPYNTLDIEVPLKILSGNTTLVQLSVTEGAYSLLYSEAADVGAQPSAYVALRSATTVASVGERVTLDVQQRGSGGAYQVYATVVSELPPAQGTQWLELDSTQTVDLAGAASVLFATWAYTTSITVGAIGQGALLDE